MSDIISFYFQLDESSDAPEIRTITHEQTGDNWFVLKDVLRAMGTATKITDAVDAINQGLGVEFVIGVPIPDSLGRAQETLIAAEAAVTYLVSRSNTDRGRLLNRFLHVDVLPQLRKTGEFRIARPAAEIQAIEMQERKISLAERVLEIAGRYQDSVLEVMAIDSIKNAFGGSSTASGSEPFQTYEVLASLGFSEKEIRSVGPSAGKLLASAYKKEFSAPPTKTGRVIDGARREVNVYPQAWRTTAERLIAENFNKRLTSNN